MNIWIAALDAHGKGGITTHISALTKQLIEMGHSVEWITPGGEITEHISNIVINTNRQLFNKYPNNLSVDVIETWAVRLEMNLRLKLGESKPDIIHCQDVIAYNRIKVIAEKWGIPILLTIHGHIPEEEVINGHIENNSLEYKYWRKSEWFALKEVGTVVSVGEGLLKYLKMINKDANVVNIPNFLHHSFSDVKISDVRSQLGIDHDQFLIFCPSRYEYIKGIDYLLDAVAALPNEYSLLLIDNGQTGLKESVANRQLNNRVKIIEPVDNQLMSSLYNASDLCAIPSIQIGVKTETSSYTAIEAMLMGVPVIASDVGGLSEVVSSWGKLVPMQDSVALEKGIIEMLGSRDRNLHYKKLAAERAANFEASKIVPEIVELYESTITQYAPTHVTPFILYGFSAKVLQMIFLTILDEVEEIKEITDFAKVRFGVSYRQSLLNSYGIIIDLLAENYSDIYEAGLRVKSILQEYIEKR
ncbi:MULTISPECIES: glycosyltransferase family 4 protein [Paenibacillus]|uniref:Glycosyl transferase group 1 n=2 Tax=Paenibacillus lactis TaxID=228574 RepID=G4HMC1_9BACL|nr:glycosyltransferase family 4 protein [Paenibacillus lactis]EHB54673.1 glycosyl transferase group 1 [Paenibacillus lactis 154]MBP1891009.1 glycosyltransferase involved in cell wall biosynthesis [Paenibacillus lactis]HAF99084.1 glycosyltransferase family 1 protein [Paenibacillus lactis]